MIKFKLVGFIISFLMAILVITNGNGSLFQNAFGDSDSDSIEDSVDEIVESAEEESDDVRDEAEDISEEAVEDADIDSDVKDRDEDEDEDEDEDKEEDTDNGDDSSDETSLINKFASDPGEDGEDGRTGPTGIGKDESEVPSGLGEGSGMQIFVSPRTIRDSIPDPTNTVAPDGGLQGTNPELESPLDMLGAITFGSAVGSENVGLQGTNPDGIIIFPGDGAINIPIDIDDIFPTGGLGASPGGLQGINPNIPGIIIETFGGGGGGAGSDLPDFSGGGGGSGGSIILPDSSRNDGIIEGSLNILFPTGGLGASPSGRQETHDGLACEGSSGDDIRCSKADDPGGVHIDCFGHEGGTTYRCVVVEYIGPDAPSYIGRCDLTPVENPHTAVCRRG